VPCDGVCYDDVFCNGEEPLEDGVCAEGEPPCPVGTSCNEAGNTCESAIPTVSAWGLAILTLLLLVGGKLYSWPRKAATG